MDWWQAIVLGIVQGLTEFLPVSSSGHLILFQELLGVDASHDELVAFDVALHAGTLIALFAYFRRDLLELAGGWVSSVKERSVRTLPQRLSWLIVLGTIPALAAYALFKPQIDAAEENMTLIACMLIGVSFIFIAVEQVHGKKQIENVRWWHALSIGIAQAIALIPGTSRSGATISTGLVLGFERQAAARFSFLLSAPVVLAAIVHELPDLVDYTRGDPQFLVAVVLGFIASALAGFVAVAALLRFLGGHSLAWFAAYRIPAGLFFLWYFTIR